MYVGQSAQVLVYLIATGLAVTDVTARYWKPGLISLPAITAFGWTEIGQGLYVMTLDGALFDRVGFFHLEVAASGSPLFTKEWELQSIPVSLVASPPMCLVTGNLVDLTGRPATDESVVFRFLSMPHRIGQSLAVADRIITKPDAYGNFSVQLVQGAACLVQIPQAGIDQQFDVPSVPAINLADLLHVV